VGAVAFPLATLLRWRAQLFSSRQWFRFTPLSGLLPSPSYQEATSADGCTSFDRNIFMVYMDASDPIAVHTCVSANQLMLL